MIKYLVTNSKINKIKMKISSIMSLNNKLKSLKGNKKISSFINKFLKYPNKILNISIIKLYNPIMSQMPTSKDSPVDSPKYTNSVAKIIDPYSFVKTKEDVSAQITTSP